MDPSDVGAIPATLASVDAELAHGAAGLAGTLGVRIAADWPPEHHDETTLAYTRERLAEGAEQQGWWLHYLTTDEDGGPVVVGTGGFKGAARGGVVEVGYSVVPSRRNRGIATAATRLLIETARRRDPGIRAVVAHTLPTLAPSIAVLGHLGFVPTEPSEPGVLAYRLALAEP